MLSVGTGFDIANAGSNPSSDDVYPGFAEGAEEHIVWRSPPVLAYGSSVGASTATPDLFVVPEPAGVMLIGVVVLALRASAAPDSAGIAR